MTAEAEPQNDSSILDIFFPSPLNICVKGSCVFIEKNNCLHFALPVMLCMNTNQSQ